jgi:TIR domain
LRNLFLVHAAADHQFASRLAQFLEFGCDVHCPADEGLIPPGQDLIGKAEEGLAADVLVLLLSGASWTTRWPRERWEPVLFEATRDTNVEVFSILLSDCPFPPLLRRRNFIDATSNPLAAMRLVKRWVWRWGQGAAHSLNSTFSPDLEDLYTALADQSGTLKTGGEEASRFAKEASQEFEAVLWIPCHCRSLAQVTGELGSQLGLTLEGTADQNCHRIQDLLASRRCLLILDSPAPELAAELIPPGRTSTLVTREPVSVVETPGTLAHARKLIASRRYAEAYELLYSLLDAEVAPADCARELSWICEHWNRAEESKSLRFHYRLPPTEQLSLF